MTCHQDLSFLFFFLFLIGKLHTHPIRLYVYDLTICLELIRRGVPVELESSLALYLFKVLVIKIVLFIFATVTVMDLYFLVTQ